MADFALHHVRGLTGCSLYHHRQQRQPAGPRLATGLEKVELITGGRAWAYDGATEVEAVPGTIIWHRPGERLVSRTDLTDPYSCLVVTWSVYPAAPRRVPRFTRWQDHAEVLAYTRQLLASYSDDRIDRRALALACYAHLQWRAHHWAVTAADPLVPLGLQRTLAALEADPTQDWPVEAMARVAGWSASRLHAAFRTHLQRSPHQHLLDLRLRRVRELLVTSNEALAPIARRCGLGSAAALCRHFRRSAGMSPTTYRERQRL